MSVCSSITIGPHKLHQLNFNQIQPGDFLCTYEVLTTRPDLLFIQTMQKYASPFRTQELNKMFHAEVILQKYPNLGMYKIAHADGGLKKIVVQDDNFKDHHPGQAFIIFRAKDIAIRNEIITVADRTSMPDNGHICKTLNLTTLPRRINYVLKSFLFENLRWDASPKTLRNLKSMVVNYDKMGRFYDKEGSGSQTMTCIEYVANVINVAAIRVLTDKTSMKSTNTLTRQIKIINESRLFPLKYSHSDASPASFVDFFLKNPVHFETVGYLGAITTPLEGPSLNIQGEPIQISPSILSELLGLDTLSPTDQLYIAKVMRVLGILNSSWQMYSKAAIDSAKIQALYVFIQAQKTDIPTHPDLFIEHLETYVREGKQSQENFYNLPKIGPLSYKESQQILFLEKEFIKNASITRTEKTLKLSINVLGSEMASINEIKRIAKQQFSIGKTMLKTVIFAPFYIGFSIVGHALNHYSLAKEKKCIKKLEEILIVYEKIRKNARFVLLAPNVIDKHRPWMHYSVDEEKTWNVVPLTLQNTFWKAEFHIPKNKDIQYRLFMGPEDVNDPDPMGNIQTSTKTTFVTHNELRMEIENGVETLIMPTCYYPD